MSTLTKMGRIGDEARSRQLSSVGCVVWSVAYALAMVVAINLVAAPLLLANDRKTKQENHRHNAATARFIDNSYPFFVVL